MMLSSHQKRILTALLLLAALAVVIGLGGWPLRLAVMAVSALAMLEFFSMYWQRGLYRGRKALGIFLGLLVVLTQAVDPLWTLCALAFSFGMVALLFLYDFGNSEGEARLGHYSPLLHGLMYIPLVLQLALYLHPAEQCLVLAAAIASDTGGYYAGFFFGGKKLWPLVSPKKTWAGFFGGMAACTLVCILLGGLGNSLDWRMPQMPLWVWIFVGLALHLGAVAGDLFESAIKRGLGVKDSGTLLPGHGGILDRIDSLLCVLPLFVCLRQCLRFVFGF